MSATSGKGNYLSKALIERALGTTAFTPAATLYCALYTATPSAVNGSGTEVTGGSYARVAITNNVTNFPASSLVAGITTLLNGTVIDFGTASADWGVIGWAALYDASTSGNLYYWGPLAVSRTVLNGDGFKIPISGATFTEI